MSRKFKNNREFLEFYLHLLYHVYLRVEHEIYRGLPPSIMMKALEIIDEKSNMKTIKAIKTWTLRDLISKLKDIGYIKNAKVSYEGNIVKFSVEKCRYAQYIHPILNNREYLCPYAILAFYILKNTYRKKKIHFAGKLPELTSNGSTAVFIIK